MRQVPVFAAALVPVVCRSPLDRHVCHFTLCAWHFSPLKGGDWR